MENSVPQKCAILLIDVPNICHTHLLDGTEGFHFVENINWTALIQRMLSSLHADHFLYIGNAYLYAKDGRKHTIDMMTDYMKKGLAGRKHDIGVHVRSGKDIDVMIVNDMWEAFVSMWQVHNGHGMKPPYEVTVLLAGGDGAYAYPAASIRHLLGGTLGTLRLHTFAWGGSLSRELSEMSQYAELLENGPSIIMPSGHR